MKTKMDDEIVRIKCTSISYDPEFATDNLKKSMIVELSREMFECLLTDDQDENDLDYDCCVEYCIDEISEMTGCPVLSLKLDYAQFS